MRLFTSISLLFFATFLFGQEVDCTRSASLTGANGYTNTGTCTLERFDDGRVVLNMSQDFAVSRGPDLRIYLSNSARSTNDGIELFLISDILGSNVFSGALSFELPADINIEDFTHVVTYCKALDNYGVLESCRHLIVRPLTAVMQKRKKKRRKLKK
jgi:hypothetical protein